ncbi:hypothetical protein Tco_0116994 [Tanacetum coccineum]
MGVLHLQPHTRTYSTPVLTQKVFSNMKRVTKGYSGEDIPLFASMITTSKTSPSRITSSPSLSPQHTPFTIIFTSQPSNIHTTPVTEEAAYMPHKSPLQSVHSLGRDEGSLSLLELTVLCTNLSNKVKKLEQIVKTSQSRRRTRVVLSDDEEVYEDPSKQGRSLIEELNLDAEISLVPPHDSEIQEKISNDTEVTIANTALNTASIPISTASATPEISIAAANLVYIRRSAEKRKDKGKAIMIEDESVQKKSKRQLEQERLKEYDKAGKKEVVAEVDTAHVIDWNDPSVISYDDIRPIFEKVWDQVHSFVPMDSEEEVQRLKRAVPDEGINVEALQTKYLIIRWEVYSKDIMQFWKIIRVGNYTEVYQVFEDMLKNFDRDDMVKLWSLVQERYNSSGLTEDKEIELWVELKMLFEPDAENLLEL